MDIIEHALRRFRSVADNLECCCDDAHGIACTVHDDRRFADLALKKYLGEKPFESRVVAGNRKAEK